MFTITSNKKILREILVISFVLFLIYFSNMRLMFGGGDTLPGKYVAMSLVKEHNFDLDEYSDYLIKEYPYDIFNYGDQKLPYYLVFGQGLGGKHIISVFDPGVPLLLFFPYLAGNYLFGLGIDSYYKLMLMGKLAMVLISIASAIIIYLIGYEFNLKKWQRLLIVASYSLGTSVWSMFSQDTYQHGPGAFMILLSLYLIIRSRHKNGLFKYSLIPISFSVLIRPTNCLLLLPWLCYGFLYKRKQMVIAILLSLPIFIFFLSYNLYYFGSISQVGRSAMTSNVALMKTGNPSVFQTNYIVGLIGNLFSPSRGLFIFSPFLIFAFINLKFKKNNLALVYLLILPSIILLTIPFSIYFDWWGGYSYGNRYFMETVPYIMVLLIMNFNKIINKKLILIIFILFVAASILIEALGAFMFDNAWNITRRIDYDHDKLWSIKDSEIVYYLKVLFNKINNYGEG